MSAGKNPRKSMVIEFMIAAAGGWVALTSGSLLSWMLSSCAEKPSPAPQTPVAPPSCGASPSCTQAAEPGAVSVAASAPSPVVSSRVPAAPSVDTPTSIQPAPLPPDPSLPVVKYGGPPMPSLAPTPTPMYGGVPAPEPFLAPQPRPGAHNQGPSSSRIQSGFSGPNDAIEGRNPP
jgi:hypothetical protein